MDIGVFNFPTHYSMDVAELAGELEQRGFASLMACEHTHIPASRKSPWPGGGDLPREYYCTYDPFVALSFAASATKTLELGTGICLVPQRDPFNTAKAVASLDRLSNGRFIFGIGGGWNVDEMENHGVRYETRFKQMREHILAMKQLWTQEKGEFHGEFVDFDPAFSWPKPIQTPHPPVLLGGETDHTLKRIVEFCDGWFPRGHVDIGDGMARLRRVAEEAGRDMSTLAVQVFRPPPNKAAIDACAEAGVDRVLLGVPSEDRDSCLKILDSYAPLVG
jgi:probable F420-dependent oxidoreductase